MKSLPTRFISAVVALIVFSLTYYFFSNTGILIVAWLACFVGCYEYMRLTIRLLQPPKILQWLYLFICLNIFSVILFFEKAILPASALLIVYYIFCSLWVLAKKFENIKVLNFIAFSVLGFFYSVYLPAYALKLLMLPSGEMWFLFLLGIVFSGDVFAYFGGIFFGKKKIMPSVSPSKTIAGSASGIIGSIAFGLVFYRYSNLNLSLLQLLTTTFAAGAIAQTGDLFESLIKRVAEVKDSGRIMPGHGGSLDRFDGVYFAAPLIYALALSTQNIN